MEERIRTSNFLKVYTANYFSKKDDEKEYLVKYYSWINIKKIIRIMPYEFYSKTYSLKLIYPETNGCVIFMQKYVFLCDVPINDLFALLDE